MKKVLDLTQCTDTDQICDTVEKELIDLQAVKDTTEEIVEEFEAEVETAKPARKSILKRMTKFLKNLFKK